MIQYEELEIQRQSIQLNLDKLKTQKERNYLGQFATPIELANSILEYSSGLIPKRSKIRFLDPAFGTGSFFSALNHVFPANKIEAAEGFEVDEHYGSPASILWSGTNLNFQLCDFTAQSPPTDDSNKFNLIICNPPYVRHHYINGQKSRLKNIALSSAGMNLSGLSGLYCYFMGIAHQWMKNKCIAGWLVPSEFMDVNYGAAIKKYLLEEVTLLKIHRFDPKDVQFDDALVSSCVVWFKNEKPTNKNLVNFSYGGSLDNPILEKKVSNKVLANEKKWSRFPLLDEREITTEPKIGDFFKVKRGIATGNNKYFILQKSEIIKRDLPIEQFRPILPSPRYLDKVEIPGDKDGNPIIDNQLFVLDCKLPLDEVEKYSKSLHLYLKEGLKLGVSDGYLCKNRKLWYAQEIRSDSQFYCTYIGRSDSTKKKPFRFIHNKSKAIVTNSYLILYPQANIEKAIIDDPSLSSKLVDALNKITGKTMLDEGRVYGGGMHKLEPKELGNVPAPELKEIMLEVMH